MKFLYEFKLFKTIQQNSNNRYKSLTIGGALLKTIKSKKYKIISNNKKDFIILNHIQGLEDIKVPDDEIITLYSSEGYDDTFFKESEIKNILKKGTSQSLKAILKTKGYYYIYAYLPINNYYWIFATKSRFIKDNTLNIDRFIDEIDYDALFAFLQSVYFEGEEIETLPKPKPTTEPTIKPYEPQKPERRDPFRRRPHIQPGHEPKPKALVDEAINYERTKGKINKDIEDKLSTGKHLYGNLKAFPPLEKDNIKNYSEYLAGNRFNELVTKLRHYSKNKDFDNIDIQTMQRILITSFIEIKKLEALHKKRLEKLAVKVVMDRFMIPEGSLIFDVRIEERSNVDIKNIRREQILNKAENEINPQEIFDFEEEIQKRRLINGLIQGAANKGHYLFNLVRKELDSIDKNLVNLYGLMISSNDMNYWLMPDSLIQAFGEMQIAAGKSGVDLSTEPPTIHAVGLNFPILIHEIIKGVMEFLSLYGLPQDKKYRDSVLDATDFLDSEMWDLRLGPGIWQNFIDAIGHDSDDIKHMLYTELVQMPAREFNNFMKELLSKSPKGKQMLVDLANEIRKDLKEEEYQDAMKKHQEKNELPKKKNDDDDDGIIRFGNIWN